MELLYFNIKITKAIKSGAGEKLLNELLLVKFAVSLYSLGDTDLFDSVYGYFFAI